MHEASYVFPKQDTTPFLQSCYVDGDHKADAKGGNYVPSRDMVYGIWHTCRYNVQRSPYTCSFQLLLWLDMLRYYFERSQWLTSPLNLGAWSFIVGTIQVCWRNGGFVGFALTHFLSLKTLNIDWHIGIHYLHESVLRLPTLPVVCHTVISTRCAVKCPDACHESSKLCIHLL